MLPRDPQRLPEDFRALRPQGKAYGADVTWRLIEPAAGVGYFLVGDAAAVLDPASSHGSLKAMMTGMMAGHLSTSATHRQLGMQHASGQRCHWVERWFTHDSEKPKALYAALRLCVAQPY